MIQKVIIESVTPDGAKIGPKGIEVQVEISYSAGHGHAKRFSFFKRDSVYYSFPTEIGCTEDLSRQQVAECVRDLKEYRDARPNSFLNFLKSLGRDEAEAFLSAFEEWIQERNK